MYAIYSSNSMVFPLVSVETCVVKVLGSVASKQVASGCVLTCVAVFVFRAAFSRCRLLLERCCSLFAAWKFLISLPSTAQTRQEFGSFTRENSLFAAWKFLISLPSTAQRKQAFGSCTREKRGTCVCLTNLYMNFSTFVLRRQAQTTLKPLETLLKPLETPLKPLETPLRPLKTP